MISFIENSNLPQGKVRSLICGGLNRVLLDYLIDREIHIYFSEKNTSVDPSISNHCDIEALYLGSGRIIIDKLQKNLAEALNKDGFNVIFSEKSVSGKYPGDIILNSAVLGEYFIGNTKHSDTTVKENIENKNIIHVNQGYAKCSVLPVDDNSLITDDESIYRICLKNGLDCLLVDKGNVNLDGHEYGFIGGAGGKISKSEMMFFGDITAHKSYPEILSFLKKRNIDIISFDFPLYDFGGIIPLEEWNK